jgi:hypothetical protein
MKKQLTIAAILAASIVGLGAGTTSADEPVDHTALAWARGEECKGIPIDGSDVVRTGVGPGEYTVVERHSIDEPPPIGSGTTESGFMDCVVTVAPDGLFLKSGGLFSVDPHADTVLESRAAFDVAQRPTTITEPATVEPELGYVRAAEVRAAETEPAVCEIEYLFNGDPSKARNRVGIRAEGCGPVTVYAFCARRTPGPVVVEHTVTDGHIAECEPGEHAAHVTYVKEATS